LLPPHAGWYYSGRLTSLSACSASVVLGAAGFAKEAGFGEACLLEYAAGTDGEEGEVPDSFAGYAFMVFS
jgi:predicted class III extradiol MEMO1 family dioxygenase